MPREGRGPPEAAPCESPVARDESELGEAVRLKGINQFIEKHRALSDPENGVCVDYENMKP
eukprot:13352310-Heterocapsa_arctica.AAC.1